MQRADWYWLSRPLPGTGQHPRGIGIRRPSSGGGLGLAGPGSDMVARSEPRAANGLDRAPVEGPIKDAIMTWWRIWNVDGKRAA